ncbi:MAG: DUF3800 domain-containing protein [Chloroflexi bacterium]|nr:DUF3800 domain-containing protein [Chloroflexota bacterium]
MTVGSVSQPRFTLYLDETGEPGLVNIDPVYPVLCLCGCIIEDEAYRSAVIPALDGLKTEWFGTAQLTLHYSEIMKRSGPYVIFRDPARLYTFELGLAALIQRLPLVILAASIHKTEYRQQYGVAEPAGPSLPLDLYLLAVDFVIERLTGFLEQQRGIASAIVVEARGKRENRLLAQHYAERLKSGTQFYSSERFNVLPRALSLKSKADRVAGLEVADLLAPPIATRTLRADAEQKPLWQAIKPKIWLRGDDRPGGVGLKTFPSSIGRAIMQAPSKSANGP